MVIDLKQWRQYDADLAGIGLMVLVALLGYPLLIHSPLTDSLRFDQVRAERDAQTADNSALRAQVLSLREQNSRLSRRLTGAEVRLPDDHTVDDLLLNLNGLASRCGIVLTRVQPMAVSRHDGYRVFRFLVEGKATFPAIWKWFSMVESDVAYLDISHFAIQATQERDKEQNTLCTFECSQKYYVSEPPSKASGIARKQ